MCFVGSPQSVYGGSLLLVCGRLHYLIIGFTGSLMQDCEAPAGPLSHPEVNHACFASFRLSMP